ncbi:Nitrous oxide reductase maturation protein, outer-membrane lipoprotein NosL [hydrothermal vent metagenome]|uniref:Nitrous oxide reductase maturation protein, outer-membrane lipoprotein NosL n=1 Tax=hydrothermal vent metagenome TaxID=652676 RepID=A0A3B1CQC1_9ZZZZ
METLKLFFISIFIFTFIVSCAVEKSPINYGKDACHFCKMNIVDKQHAAEIVTKKGKAFKYDSIECMINDVKKRDENRIALYLIDDYSTPGKLIDATTATYLISENLPSPMGANLNGFESKEKTAETQKEKGGTIYSWDELRQLFNK